jgi:hypothetical protein
VRDALVSMVRAWHAALERAIRLAIEAGHLRPTPTPLQMLFEVHGLILALHHDARFLRNARRAGPRPRGFDRVVRARQAGRQYPPGARRGAQPRAPLTFPIRQLPQESHHAPVHPAPARHAVRAARLLGAVDELKLMPRHADIDADTLNAVLEEAGKFAAEVIAPLNSSGDAEGCVLDKATHEVRTPKGFKQAYASTWKAAGRR